MGTVKIKVTDDRQGNTFRTGVNGRFYDLPVNQTVEVDEGLIDHLTGLGAAFEEVEGSSKRASSSQEGSGEELAPTGPHDVRAPGTDAKSLGDRPLAGDQPGDVTASGGVQFGAGGNKASIKEDAEISDIRVAAERRTQKDAPVAELAGEGEQGAPRSKPQSVEPTHKQTDDEKRQAKEGKADTSKAQEAAKKANANVPSSAKNAK